MLALSTNQSAIAHLQVIDMSGKLVHKQNLILQSGVNSGIMTGKVNNITVYPNPVTDVLSIKLRNPEKDQLKIGIDDMNGKTIYRQTNLVNENTAELRVDIKSWRAQVYILKVSNSRGEFLSTGKVIKL